MTSTGPIAPLLGQRRDAPSARTAVTVLAGFRAHATAEVADRLLRTEPSLLLVRHDFTRLRDDGVVRRIVRDATTVYEDVDVVLEHGCVSCTIRKDVLPVLMRLARDVPGRPLLVSLPEVVEPQTLAEACAHAVIDGTPAADVLRVDSCVAVLDALTLAGDLNSVDDLAHRRQEAAADDTRSVAEVVVRQIEYADTVLLRGESASGAYETSRLALLVRRLAPWAAHPSPADDAGLAAALLRTSRHDPAQPPGPARALAGMDLGVHEPHCDDGVISMLFTSRRPFHPVRLHEKLDELAYPAIRARGHLWLATQPDTAIAFETAGGGVWLGALGMWLDALPAAEWEFESSLRRVAASLEWDPYYGDRGVSLAFIGEGFDVDELRAVLSSCLVADAEIAEGMDAWKTWDDPFEGCFPSRI